jgi:polyhydroxybutyrate depolymerase
MKKLFLVCLASFAFLSCASFAQREEFAVKSIDVDGRLRSYYLHVPFSLPKDKPAALVIVFHGGGGEGAGTARLTKFNQLSDKENFIAVYPNGVGNNWNDGREDFAASQAHKENVDDVVFINAMIDAIAKEHKIDQKRIYATGISNGGIFSHYLGANLSNRIAAIAPVVGGIADPFYKNFNPKQPVSILIIQGTADPLVPYDGGVIARNRGKIIGTDETVKLWLKNNGGKDPLTTKELFDKDKTDGCSVDKIVWSGGKNKTEVVLYKLIGGGHTWAGSSQYLPRPIVGSVCREINATEIIWEFFKQHPKP